MEEDENRAIILKAVKDRVRLSEEQQRVQMIADAIGERRERDLLDVLSSIEQDRGWPETVKHLLKAQNFSYALPVGTGLPKTKVEALKFREMIFSVLGCRGLEPVPIDTEQLLTRMKDECSMIDASFSLHSFTESIARDQIISGDTLFFDSNDFDIQVSEDTIQLADRIKNEEVQGIALEQKNGKINITPLWYCESSRQALSNYGIKGYIIESNYLEEVLSVIQFQVVINSVTQYTKIHNKSEHPSNVLYHDLHSYIINHDNEGLSSLSSRLSFATLKSMLEETVDSYNKDPSSENYRRFLHLIHTHVKVRAIESIQLLEGLAYIKDARIATVAITALGNFYHESAASALVEILCKNKNREIVKTVTNAILNVGKKCPETVSVISTGLESSICTYKGRLKRLLRDVNKNYRLYY